MFGNLVASLIAAEAIVTTEAKAKALRPVIEKVITKAKKGGVHHQRQVVAFIRDKDMAHKLFEEIGPRYADRRAATPASSSSARATATTRRWRGSNSSRSCADRNPRPLRGGGSFVCGRPPGVPGAAAAHLWWPLLAAGPAFAVPLGDQKGPTNGAGRARLRSAPLMTLFDPDDADVPPLEARTWMRLLFAYDGAGFSGFPVQPGGVKTIAAVLGDAIAKVLKHPVKFTVAGRTDAGVHAWGNVCHFDSPLEADEIDCEKLQRAVNKMCRPKIVVREVAVAPTGFDARFSASARRYRYTVLNRPVPDPFLHATSWHVEDPLDLRAMQLACDPLLGEHDFSSFCRKPPKPTGSNIRRLHDARWLDLGDGRLRFDVEASSFCQQMVRSIVGTLVDVGLGRKRAGDISWILRSKDRVLAASPAPPQGLCLWEVVYP